MLDEPWVSAVIQIRRPDDDSGRSNLVTDEKMRLMAVVKTHFTSAGFEVHAPLTSSFSIGGRQSLFERAFGLSLKIDHERLGSSVTTESGDLDLPLEGLPAEVQDAIVSISFPPPPPFAT